MTKPSDRRLLRYARPARPAPAEGRTILLVTHRTAGLPQVEEIA